MAERNPPLWINTEDYIAETLRLGEAAHWPGNVSGAGKARSGVVPRGGDPLKVITPSSSSLGVRVQVGDCVVQGSNSSVQGAYLCHVTSTHALTLATAHSSLTRHDLIVARVYDSQYTGALNVFKLEVVTGAAGGGVPAAPANSLALASVQVGPNAGTIISSNITDLRVFTTGPGGIIPSKSTESINANGYTGLARYNTDKKELLLWDGASWSPPAPKSTQRSASRASAGSGFADFPAGVFTFLERVTWTSAPEGNYLVLCTMVLGTRDPVTTSAHLRFSSNVGHIMDMRCDLDIAARPYTVTFPHIHNGGTLLMEVFCQPDSAIGRVQNTGSRLTLAFLG